MTIRQELQESGNSSIESEKISLEALNYETKPILFDASTAFISGIFTRTNEHITFDPRNLHNPNLPTLPFVIPSSQIYSAKLLATMEGLNEALVRTDKGEGLREMFQAEYEKWMGEMMTKGDAREYGVWAYYPRTMKLTQMPPREIHRLALVSSTSSLYLNPEMDYSFLESQEILQKTVVAVMGQSVGSNISKAVRQLFRPDDIIIADPKEYKTSNQNRVLDLTFDLMFLSELEVSVLNSIGAMSLGSRNKALVTAEQMHAEEAYGYIFCYQNGVNPQNERTFLEGNRIQPKAHIAVDVADTTSAKIGLARTARDLGIRYIRITDAGDSVWMDIRHFDLDRSLSISPNCTDEELLELEKNAERSKDDFFKFASALIGPESLRMTKSEFPRLIKGKIPKYTTSIPQSGATTMVGGGFTANTVARMRMGHQFYERMCFDMRGVRTRKLFNKVPGMIVT